VANWQYSRVTLLPIQSTRAEDAQQEALVWACCREGWHQAPYDREGQQRRARCRKDHTEELLVEI
jgi:hypothetical protein